MSYYINHEARPYSRITSLTMFQLFFSLWWMRHTVLSFAEPVLRALPIIGSVGDYIIPAMMLVVLLFAMPHIVRRLRHSDLLFYLIIALLVVGTMLFLPDNQPYIAESLWQIMGVSAAAYFLGIACDLDHLKKPLYWCSTMSVLLMYAYQLYQLALGRELVTDNMNASYNVLPSVLYLIYHALGNKGLRLWVMPAVGGILILTYGTRGPILVIVAYVLLAAYVKYVWSRNGSRKVGYTLLVSALLIILAVTDIMLEAAKTVKVWFEHMGFSVRILNMFIDGEIANDTARGVITSKLTEAIWDRPLLGYGLMGDRVVLLAGEGDYAHNFFMEMWCDFGIVFGTGLILIVACLAIAAISKKKNDCMFILMIVAMVMIKLTFSGSFIIEPYFFFMLGICIRAIRNAPQRRGVQRQGGER